MCLCNNFCRKIKTWTFIDTCMHLHYIYMYINYEMVKMHKKFAYMQSLAVVQRAITLLKTIFNLNVNCGPRNYFKYMDIIY